MEGFCRGCLIRYNEPAELLEYTEKNRRLFVYSTGIQVKRNDTFTFQLCKDCYINMKTACKFKKLCRTSDKKYKNYVTLKEVGDAADLCTYLKNTDDSVTLRFPTLLGNSTPANQKNRDDDNESTCTSIGNFMSDILQGEEMPDTEARIIRQVIEEEADVLDDSLDSHWLQDDVSIDTDFRLDFNFSPFSTPRSVTNDHCYTPRRLMEPQPILEVPKSIMNKTIPEKSLKEDNLNLAKEIKHTKEILGIKEFNEENLFKNQAETEISNVKSSLENEIEPNVRFDNQDDYTRVQEELDIDYEKDEELGVNIFDEDIMGITENIEDNLIIEQVEMTEMIQVNSKNYYVDNDNEANLFGNKDIPENTVSDTIDRNLENALRDNNNKEFALDALLVSPDAAFISPSTRSIEKILFGETPKKIDSPIKNISMGTDELSKKEDSLDIVFKDFDGKSAKLGSNSISSIENILFGENIKYDKEVKDENVKQINEDSNITNTVKEEITNEILNNENKESKHTDIEASYINALDEFFNVRDMKLDFYAEKDTQKLDDLFDFVEFYCKSCKKKFPHVKALKIHSAKIHKIKLKTPQTKCSRICSECGMAISDARNFNRHMKTHLKLEYRCHLCPFTFAHNHLLKRHIKGHKVADSDSEPDKKKRYCCNVCGFMMASRNTLAMHRKRHNQEYTTHCDDCGKGFYAKTDLTIHIRRNHTNEMPYKCDFCTKSFPSRTQLIKHYKVHSGERKFQCDLCNRVYLQKLTLIRHLSTCCPKLNKNVRPKREKLYECYYCHQKCTHAGGLRVHQKTSTKCLKLQDVMLGRNKSTLKVQMPFLYVEEPKNAKEFLDNWRNA